jgi:hypothetical protein
MSCPGRIRSCGSWSSGQADQLAEANATIAVLQRIVFGRSSEKSGPDPGRDDDDAGGGGKPGGGKKKQVKRGPRARSGRRDYSGCRGSRCSWTSRVAVTAARSAGSRSRPWAITGPGSSWTGRISNTATGVAASDRHAGCQRALSQDFRVLTPRSPCGWRSASYTVTVGPRQDAIGA